jgi:hypothetical protein
MQPQSHPRPRPRDVTALSPLRRRWGLQSHLCFAAGYCNLTLASPLSTGISPLRRRWDERLSLQRARGHK